MSSSSILSSVLPRHDRVDAAGVVADHAAQRAAVVRGRVGAEGEVMSLRRVAQVVEHDAGLHARQLLSGSSSTMRFMYFEKSSTTATLQLWPARLVPPPRESTGAPWRRQSGDRLRSHHPSSRGSTTPIGTWR